MIVSIEQHVEWIARLPAVPCASTSSNAIEADASDAEHEWVEHVNEVG